MPLTQPQVEKVLRKIRFARSLGVRLVRLHRDGITLECPIREKLLNSAGVVHGGVSATLADCAVGVAIHRHIGSQRPLSTVEMKINYFRPVSEGRIFARSRLLRVGATLCVGRVDLTDQRGRVLGTALVTYMLLAPPTLRFSSSAAAPRSSGTRKSSSR